MGGQPKEGPLGPPLGHVEVLIPFEGPRRVWGSAWAGGAAVRGGGAWLQGAAGTVPPLLPLPHGNRATWRPWPGRPHLLGPTDPPGGVWTRQLRGHRRGGGRASGWAARSAGVSLAPRSSLLALAALSRAHGLRLTRRTFRSRGPGGWSQEGGLQTAAFSPCPHTEDRDTCPLSPFFREDTGATSGPHPHDLI